MAMARTPARRRRARRGSLERPVNARLYRGVVPRPRAAAPVLAFSDRAAGRRCRRRSCRRTSTARRRDSSPTDLSTHFPDRAPGGPGSLARRPMVPRPARAVRPARLVRHLGARRCRASAHVQPAQPLGGRRRAVVGRDRRDGAPRRHGRRARARTTTRAAPPRSSSSPAATRRPSTPAAQRVRSAHTIVFLSTDGGAFGGLGALRFAERSPFHVVATINLTAIAGPRAAAHRDHRRHAALTRGRARRDRGEARARADRARARGAPGFAAAADRPRLSVHPLRAGPVRRARHSRGHADDRPASGRRAAFTDRATTARHRAG